MPVDSGLWNQLLANVPLSRFPKLCCPSCGAKELVLDPSDIKLRRLKNQYDVAKFERDDFDEHLALRILGAVAFVAEELQWEQCRFNAFLSCKTCGEVTSVLGKAKVPNKNLKSYTSHLETQLILEYFAPALPIIPLPAEYPISVRRELSKSFASFFSDPASAGNRVRTTVEALLDEQGIDKIRRDAGGNAKTSGSGRRIQLSLGERLQLFAKTRTDFATMLGAIKGIGNQASHGADINRADLLTAFQIIDYVLSELYISSQRHTALMQVSNTLKGRYA
jgi:hypothetical protein